METLQCYKYITVKSEHAVMHAFEKHLMFYKRVLVHTKNNLRQCRNIVLGNITKDFLP